MEPAERPRFVELGIAGRQSLAARDPGEFGAWKASPNVFASVELAAKARPAKQNASWSLQRALLIAIVA